MELNKTQMKKIIFLIVFSVLLIAMFQHFKTFKQIYNFLINVTMPFVSGLCIAFIINVLMKLIENNLFKFLLKPSKSGKSRKTLPKLKRPVSLILSYIIIFGLIGFLIFLLIPQLQNSISIIADRLPDYIENVKVYITDLFKKYNITPKKIQNFKFDWNKIYDYISNYKIKDAHSMFGKTLGITSSIFNVFFNLFFGLIFATFVLINKEKLAIQSKKFFFAYFKKNKVDFFLDICSITNKSFTKFITGQCIDALIIAILCFIGMVVLKIPYPALVSTIIGFTALVPVIGAFIGTIIGVLLIILVSPIKTLWFVIFIIILQQLETNLIYPRVVGKSVGLPAIWMIVAATVGGSLFGITGVILSVPIVSIIYTLLRESTHKRLAQKNIEVS